MTDPTGTTTWTYDSANRLTGQTNATGVAFRRSAVGWMTYKYVNIKCISILFVAAMKQTITWTLRSLRRRTSYAAGNYWPYS